ncbi:MAG TPA: MBL fold metallo-hydrolase [Pyrinomonadaceae bacterium]|jgi:glyoxylase-like metal-dependent hydrolase (beta-lactamase superfamily II)
MIIETFVLSPFQQNTRIVACEKTKLAICIDPGEKSPALVDFLHENDLRLQAIALTHAHLDHIGGVSALGESFPDAEILLHAADENLYYGLPDQPIFMGFAPHQLQALGLDYETPPQLTRNWKNGEVYAVGDLTFKVLHAPGHTPGHVVFVEESERKVFSGDCLFAGSIGRTDLPGGDFEQLMDSINRQILTLGDDFVVYSGHGSDTTVGRERMTNPFLNDAYQIKSGGIV